MTNLSAVPFWDRDWYLYNILERHRELVQYEKQKLQLRNEDLRKRREESSQNQFAFNELIFQTSRMVATIDQVGSDIVQAIQVLEISLGINLSEIRSVLGHIDDKLGQMLKVLSMPLGTAAHEMTVDGCKALRKGSVEQARMCFEKALEHKPSDYWALTMLGFSLLHQKQAESAIKAFDSADDFVPDDGEMPAQSLENLAIAHYESGNFQMAHEFAEQALTVRQARRCPDLNSEYALSVYCMLSGKLEDGLNRCVALCDTEPRYSVIYEHAEDLRPFKGEILGRLTAHARERHAEGERLKAAVEVVFVSSVEPLHSAKPQFLKEHSLIIQQFKRASALLERRDLSHSNLARKVFPILHAACQELPRLAGLRETLQGVEQTYEQARVRWEGAAAKHSESLRRFEKDKNETIKSTNNIKKAIKGFVFVVLAAYGIYAVVHEYSSAKPGIDTILAIIIGIPLFIVVYLVIVWIVSRIVSVVADKAAEVCNRSVQRQEFDEAPPIAESVALNEARQRKESIEFRVQESEKRVGEMLTQIDRLLLAS